MTKICGECKVEQPIENYVFKDKKKGKRQRECKECHRKHMRNYYANNREKHLKTINIRRKKHLKNIKKTLNEIKSNPCTDCALSYPPCVMDFDHIKGKEKNVSTLVKEGYNIQKILEEIAKCELVCSNCHRIRTYNRGYKNQKMAEEVSFEQTVGF